MSNQLMSKGIGTSETEMIVNSRVALHLPEKREADSSTSEESSMNYNRNLASLGLFDRKTPTPMGA